MSIENKAPKWRAKASVLLTVVACLMALFHEYTTATLPLSGFMQMAVHLGFAMTIVGLAQIAGGKSDHFTVWDMVGVIIIVFGLVTNLRILATKGFISPKLTANLSTMDTILAVLIIVGILLAVQRAIGTSMSVVAIVFLAYAFVGPYLPGLLKHNGITLNRLLSSTYLTVQGVFGTALSTSAKEIFPLMIYGGIMVSFGGGDLMMALAEKAFGTFRGGIAKVSVLSSALFGMVSGAGPANAATTGTFTIPMMKKSGYSAPFAGAVEATASVGGQIMPPIMGASAFIMAENLNLSYTTLILCALPAALMYYTACFLAVDVEAQRLHLEGMSKDDIPALGPIMKENWYLLISIGTLIVLLCVFNFGPGTAGFWATSVLLVSEIVANLLRRRKFPVRDFLSAVTDGAKSASNIAVACAAAGIILCVVDRSGLAVKMTSLMVTISGGNTALMLIMSAIASLIMGMALPTVACYVIVASLCAPPLISAGVPAIAAHFFAFYFGLISNITPPVALTAFVAAGIAEANPIKTACHATRLGIAGFIVPFMFVYDPSILLQGTLVENVYGIFRCTVVVLSIAVMIGGYWKNHKMPILSRALILVSAVLIFLPFSLLDIPSYLIIAGVFAYQTLVVAKKQPKLAGTSMKE